MAMPTPIPDSLVELIAERFRLLSEPMRIRALDQMREAGEVSVGELASSLGASQQNISKHLSVLHAGGVLSRRRDGNRVLYAIADESVMAICEAVCGSLERSAGERSELFRSAA